MCREEKLLIRHNKDNKVAKYLLNYFFKKIQKQSLEVFCKKKKVFLKILQKFCKLHRKTSVLEYFLNKVAGLQPAGFLKSDSNISAFL